MAEATASYGQSSCGCENTCKNIKDYVPPTDDWWESSATSCDLVVDPDFGGALKGTVYAQVREATNADVTYVIDTDDDWVIDVHITVTGKLVFLCGRWCISACLESMCGPEYYRFPQDSTPGVAKYCCCLIKTEQFTTDYNISICVPAETVKVNECGAPYELTVIVTLLSESQMKPGDECDPSTYMPLGVATACELPLMTFYEGV